MTWPDTPSFVAATVPSTTANNIPNPSSHTSNAPSRSIGDLLVEVTSCRSITATVSTPSGWNLVSGFPIRSATASGGSFYVFTRIATSTSGAADDCALSWSGVTTGTSGDSSRAFMMSFNGVREALDGSLATTQDQASTTSFTINACSPSGSKALWIGLGMRVHDTAHTFTLTNFPSEAADVHTTSGTGHGLIVGYEALTASGSTGTSTVTPSNTTSVRTLTTALCFSSALMGNALAIDQNAPTWPVYSGDRA